MTQYVIIYDKPYHGHIQSVILPNGLVAFSGGQTLPEDEALAVKFT